MSILFQSEQDEIPQHTREAMDSLLNTISDLQKSNKTLRASLKEAYEEGWITV